jgi:hypothetical protein
MWAVTSKLLASFNEKDANKYTVPTNPKLLQLPSFFTHSFTVVRTTGAAAVVIPRHVCPENSLLMIPLS